jgi:hypothetical protein
MKRRILVVLLCFFTSGCAALPNYPSQLSPLVPGDERAFSDCPDIAGRYSDRGIVISPEGKDLGYVSLTQIFHEKDSGGAANLTNADTVMVIGPEKDRLEIQSWQGAIQLSTWEKPKKEVTGSDFGGGFTCQRGFINFYRAYSSGAEKIGVGFSADVLWLRKAVDGSLIIYHRDRWAALIFVIPIWHTKQNAWYSFPPVGEGVQPVQ